MPFYTLPTFRVPRPTRNDFAATHDYDTIQNRTFPPLKTGRNALKCRYDTSANFHKNNTTPPPPRTLFVKSYYGFRYYSPELGRWPNRDPLGDEAFLIISDLEKLGVTEPEKNSVGPLYVFADNNPQVNYDHLGLVSISFDVETEIKRPKLPGTGGVKSVHYFSVDTITLDVSNEIKRPGSTFGISGGFDGDRDVSRDQQNPCNIRVEMEGRAWTSFQGFPGAPPRGDDINYRFVFLVDTIKEEIFLIALHDGYPSYRVSVNGGTEYSFNETTINKLAAPMDQSDTKTFNY